MRGEPPTKPQFDGRTDSVELGEIESPRNHYGTHGTMLMVLLSVHTNRPANTAATKIKSPRCKVQSKFAH